MGVRPQDHSLEVAAVNLTTKQNNVVKANRKKKGRTMLFSAPHVLLTMQQ